MGQSRPYLTVLAAAVVFAAGTWVLRTTALKRVERNAGTVQADWVSRAFRQIDDDFQGTQRAMVTLAQSVARAPSVRVALDESRSRDEKDEARLIAHFASLDLPDYTSVELYTPTPRLLAWNGFSMPLDQAPADEDFLRTYQTAVARDGDARTALVLWWPIRDGPRVYGAVRVLRVLESRAPVQNEYLRDYDIARIWTRESGLPVELVLGEPADSATEGAWQQLRGVDGSPVGVVRAELPDLDDMTSAIRGRYDSVLAFWIAMALTLGVLWLYRLFRERVARAGARALPAWAGFAAGLWVTRYALLWLRFPERIQQGKSPLAPVFDPTHFASDLFGGVMRTSGDFMLTAVAALLTAVTLYGLVVRKPTPRGLVRLGRPVLVGLATSCLLAVFGLIVLLSLIARAVVLDATLDYFARTGLVPDVLILGVFAAALLTVASAVVISAALSLTMFRFVGALRLTGLPYVWSLALPAAVAGAVVGAVYLLLPLADTVNPELGVVMFACFGATAVTLHYWGGSGLGSLTLRNALFGVFVLAAFLYPMMYSGLQAQKRTMLIDAADTFDNGSDPRVVFSIERILEEAASDSLVARLVSSEARSPRSLDSVATAIVRPSLLASLRSYEVNLTLLDAAGRPRGRYYEAEQQISRASLEDLEIADFELLRAMYVDAGGPATLVEQITGRHERERFRYEGLRRIRVDGETVGWVMAGAEPRSMAEELGSPFPRVFVSTGFYGSLGEDISLAEFRDGVLVRTTGSAFTRIRLDEDVAQELHRASSVWRREQTRGRLYDTYYARQQGRLNPISVEQTVVVAARAAATGVFDHLYSLLRLTVAGLFVALPLYLLGIVLRWRAGQLPAPRVRFRDKVLNAFFAVGIITVAAMGFVGLQVVTGENDRAVDSWLKQHLERVERTLAAEARAGELPYRVLDRISIDSLSAQVGLDLNLFQGTELVASSRPQLIRDRLIDRRLPIEAYSALNFEGYRFVSTDESAGSVTYSAGFRALPDEVGRPRYVLSLPTLPEQERIEEERARTVAYLFGALLLLVLVVLATASVLANALTRPIARLRVGLEAVAKGRFEGIKPVNSRDEFGDLVETFNTMQGQLSDTQRQLAQQERQLAWQEMARQVAHEIKNPLTPMKLSVQHLQRALDASNVDNDDFRSVFSRITKTLVEQIDALARIANEFSSFARMPRQDFERVDLNAVVREAEALMQAENGAVLVADYATAPLDVRADREELRRLFINLLKNAFQAVPEDREPEVHVRTRAAWEGATGFAYCEISDNGAGIPEDLQDRIFEPNFSTKTSGTGLGLAIVRKSIEDMRGAIGFETSAGSGTTFWIRLPLADARAVDDPTDRAGLR